MCVCLFVCLRLCLCFLCFRFFVGVCVCWFGFCPRIARVLVGGFVCLCLERFVCVFVCSPGLHWAVCLFVWPLASLA